MKKVILYITALLCALLASVSCSKEGPSEPTGGMGTLVMNFSATRTDGDTYDPFEHIAVRIYNAEGGLIRKYTSREAVPAKLQLLAGDYRIAVEAGDKAAASFVSRSYKGEAEFTITAGATSSVEVECRLINVVVEVKFDRTVPDNFGENFYAWMAAGADFDEKAAEAEEIPALRFTSDRKGYLLLPEGETTLSWLFRGEHASRGTVEKSGVIREVKAGGKYVLSLRFSPDLPGFIGFTLSVDTSTDDQDDTIIFSPDPTIKGEDFDMEQRQDYTSGEKRFNISSMGVLQTVTLEMDGTVYDLLDPTAAGIVSTRTDDYNLTVALNDEFFAGQPGGSKILTFTVEDADGGKLATESTFRFEGLIPVRASDYDLWHNTATLKAVVFDGSAQAVKFNYRRTHVAGIEVEENWQEVDGVLVEDNIYQAAIAPTWQEATNDAGLKIYTPAAHTGIFANAAYACNVVFDGTPHGEAAFDTATTQTIPDGDMENGSLPCFGVEVSSSSPFWASGNNSFAKTLCAQSTLAGMEGAHCAKLASSSPPLVGLAAGNLMSGLFYKDGLTTGVVEFGQPYTWQARPKAMRVKYHAQVGTINNDKGYAGPPLKSGDQDVARIFVCIVNWNSRHKVSSGTSAPTGPWDPATTTQTAEGSIIGYGSLFIDSSTEGNDMIQAELALQFYDKDTKPSGQYGIVISSSANAYGDYMLGCTSNVLYVDDFAWVY